MTNNKITSLYELIKKTSQEKGRPLKIICDWDNCLFSTWSTAVYKFSDGKIPFKEFFNDFWEKVSVIPNDDNPSEHKKFIYNGTGEAKIAWEKFVELEGRKKKTISKKR